MPNATTTPLVSTTDRASQAGYGAVDLPAAEPAAIPETPATNDHAKIVSITFLCFVGMAAGHFAADAADLEGMPMTLAMWLGIALGAGLGHSVPAAFKRCRGLFAARTEIEEQGTEMQPLASASASASKASV